MDPRRPNLILRDFFLHEQRRVAEAQIHKFFRISIQYLIVINIVLGIFTIFNLHIYPNYIYEREPIIQQRSTELYPNEI